MQLTSKTKLLARLALLLVAIIWGSTLVVAKFTTGTIEPNLLIALRFLIAFVVLGAIYGIVSPSRLKVIDKGYILSGLIIGFCLFLAHSAQTIGVTDAGGDPGRSGFLSAAYCVIVPFLSWAVNRVRPDIYNLSAAVLCIAGIGFVSFGEVQEGAHIAEGFAGFSMPDALALLSGIFFAAHIVTIEKFSRGKDPILITILQFLFAGIFSTITTFVKEPSALVQADWGTVWPAVLYLATICTALALLLQNVGQRYTDPNSAAIILGTESLFCILFGVVYAGEQITPILSVGFVLIFAAIIVSETKLRFLRRGGSSVKVGES